MKINISLSSKPTTNSLGKPISDTKKGVANFWEWFGRSKVRDAEGRPIVVYHGTNADIEQINTSLFGRGNDEYGSGFYTTTAPNVASGYIDPKKPYGNVLPLYIRLEKPLNRKVNLNYATIYNLITSSPSFKDDILNFGDVEYEGLRKVTNNAVRVFFTSQSKDSLHTLSTIANTFWQGIENLFLVEVNRLVGYDGVIAKFEGSINYVTWFPNQVKSVYNNGAFGPSDRITAHENQH